MLAYVKNGSIYGYLQERTAFGISDDGKLYQGFCPDGVSGINYPANMSGSDLEALGFVEVVTTGEAKDSRYYYTGETLSMVDGVPTRTISSVLKPDDQLRNQRLSELAQLRYNTETGGMVVSGMPVKTDDRSKSLLNGALALCQAVPSTTINWKTDAGFVSLTAAQISAIAVAVGQFVQACFTNEAAHSTAIAGLSGVAIIDYDITTGWPT